MYNKYKLILIYVMFIIIYLENSNVIIKAFSDCGVFSDVENIKFNTSLYKDNMITYYVQFIIIKLNLKILYFTFRIWFIKIGIQ